MEWSKLTSLIWTLQDSKLCERCEWQLWSASKFYINRHQLQSFGKLYQEMPSKEDNYWGEQLLRQINIPNEKLIETSIPQSWTKKKENLYSQTTKNKPYSQQEVGENSTCSKIHEGLWHSWPLWNRVSETSKHCEEGRVENICRGRKQRWESTVLSDFLQDHTWKFNLADLPTLKMW